MERKEWTYIIEPVLTIQKSNFMFRQDKALTHKNLIDSHPKQRRRIAIIVFGLLAFVSYVALVSFNLIQARERELETSRAQQSSLSKILVSHAEGT